MFERFFKISRENSSIKRELIAGLTTFMAMAYILGINPDILSVTGMDRNALFTATALSAAVATLVMALVARLPLALAPGMGLNAFFAFTVVSEMGYSWQFALTAVFLEGIIFILLSIFGLRELILNSIPKNLKYGISVGVGLFIAFLGLQNAGVIVNSDATLVTLGDLKSSSVILALGGVILTSVLYILKVRGALLIGIIAVTVIGIPMGITEVQEGSLITAPPSISPIFCQLDFSNIFSIDMVIVLFTFLFLDMFDTIGGLIGISMRAPELMENGKIKRVKQALYADSIGTAVGAVLGTSTVTLYAESATGVESGGRTGLTALTVSILFMLSLFISPLFLMIPKVATTAALVIVGIMMISPIKRIDFDDYAESIPAFITILVIPFSYSISDGIAFGIISHILLKIFTGRVKDISLAMAILGLLFILKYFLL